jgi:hypothetical protein
MKLAKTLLAAAFGLTLLSSPAKAQVYDSLKTVEVAKDLENMGFNLKGYMIGDSLELQIDYNGNSELINCPLVAQKQYNDSLMGYPVSVIFNKRDSETTSEVNYVNGFGGVGFIMDDNNILPSVYADSIKKILKGTPDGVVEKLRASLESKLEGIYPNPTNGAINIKYNSGGPSHPNFKIYDVLGREVYSFEGSPGEKTENINLEDLSSGIYFLRMSSDGGKLEDVKKFMILK